MKLYRIECKGLNEEQRLTATWEYIYDDKDKAVNFCKELNELENDDGSKWIVSINLWELEEGEEYPLFVPWCEDGLRELTAFGRHQEEDGGTIEYHKIDAPFLRDPLTGKLVEDKFVNETVEYLKDSEWRFTEKIDGTNVRVVWDGHKVSFRGRTDKAEMPKELTARLEELFGGDEKEGLFEQKFGSSEVILFGEGYGPKINNGDKYRESVDFILFDVYINGLYLTRDNVKDIADYFGIEVVPLVFAGTIADAVNSVKQDRQSSYGTAGMEGYVGRPKVELRDRRGNRVIVKIKAKDFRKRAVEE